MFVVWVCLTLLFFLPLPTQAILWEFDEDDDLQGWVTREDGTSGGIFLSPLPSEVRDGVWRIIPTHFEPKRNPAVELISPLIGHDSALFDRLTIRLRVVHTRPIDGAFSVSWTNPQNRTRPLEPLLQDNSPYSLSFWKGKAQLYTADWQEIVLTPLQTERYTLGYRLYQRVWEGELIDIRIGLRLAYTSIERPFIESADEVPEAVEIDWIRLTGVEEQIQGELPPPPASPWSPSGDLFTPASFYNLGIRGLGGPWTTPSGGALGDLDGDGDLDLTTVSFHEAGVVDEVGTPFSWITALNDGNGHFGHTRMNPSTTFIQQVYGGDIDGDGRMDLLLPIGPDTRLLSNDPEAGWIVAQEWEGLFPLGLADADDDGDVDVWLADFATGTGILRLNDGKGGFDRSMTLGLDPPQPDFGPTLLVHPLGRGKRAGMLWNSAAPAQGFEVTYLDGAGNLRQDHLAAPVKMRQIRYGGDFEGDGDVDLVVSKGDEVSAEGTFHGVELWMNQGNGSFETVDWYPEVDIEPASMRFFDLNGDGRLDPVFVERNVRSPAVLVHLGEEGGWPVFEGRYPLGGQGGPVLGGDVDGDGDVDLVVIEKAAYEGGGVQVLLNHLSERVTAVAGETGEGSPAAYQLAPNYPNPFNAQTWIPFTLPERGKSVRLQVFNVLGQPVRMLVVGRLVPGYHAVPWDGKDENGQVVSSGIYLYRLQVDGWQEMGKMLKSE